MFKLESYITPLLLSYVDKYIKNFRPEDSQVSLWGGDASFHNLDLRLEVLEQELQLPFSFVSGHIHELLIHVPWTKLASEPITITINTIECILKLRGAEGTRNLDTNLKDRLKKSSNKRNEVEAPPGYVQSLVNKIVSNITIYCNNLILKYVEEDIVLSMNVKLLTFESANEKWEPAYTAQITMRKLITVNDLTVCLDKRNASGKIDVYQEPMLYRCSLVVHMLRNYHTATSKKASTTRLDVYCNNMEFSMTEQQVPMLMRLILLLCALKGNEFKGENESSTGDDSFDICEVADNTQSWAGWAWSFVPSILPVNEQTDEEQPVVPTGHTLHIGFYIDNAALTFKVSEYSNDRSYYSQKKLKYWPVLLLRFQGLYNQFIMHGLKWINVSAGISQILLIPLGCCTCSCNDIIESSPPEYLSAGSVCDSHKTDSLFDAEAVENKGQKKLYNISWDYHMSHITESTLLDKTPAVAVDYVYELTVPDDMTSEQLSDLGSDYEYSNVSIRTLLRIVVGPCRLSMCSGLVHRLGTLKAAASAYDYAPYSRPKPPPSRMELHPPSEDDYDALNGNIPMGIIQYTVIAPVIEFQIFDHPFFEPTKEYLFRKRKKMSTVTPPSTNSPSYLPKLTLECQCIDAKIQCPIYTKRLIHTVCQLPNPPEHMFEACYSDFSVKLIGFCSRLILSSNRHTTIIMPVNATYNSRTILSPAYWTDPDIAHSETSIVSDGITITVTKPKALLIVTIMDKMKKMDSEDILQYLVTTSLLNDASNDSRACLEFCIEDIKFRSITTRTTLATDLSIGSVKAFISDPVEISCGSNTKLDNDTKPSEYSKSIQSIASANYQSYVTREIQQVLFISGPESRVESAKHDETSLLKLTVQFPLDPAHQCHPPVVMFSLQEIRICIDPLLCRWALYTPTICPQKTDFIYDTLHRQSKTISETSGSMTDTSRRIGTPHESVHSSSDREPPILPLRIQKISKEGDAQDFQEKIYIFLKKWFAVWKGMLLFGDISQCTIYFPVKSLSAIGSQGIQQAVDEAMTKQHPPDILVITLPNARFRCSANKQSLMKYVNTLPVKLPEMMWSKNKSNFPWNISVSDVSCYSWQNGKKLNFLKPVSLNATVGLCTKSKSGLKVSKKDSNMSTSTQESNSPELQVFQSVINSGNFDSTKNDLSSLGICIHVDMTPTNIIMSELQISLIASILYGLIEVFNNFTYYVFIEPLKQVEIVPLISTQSATTSPTILKESTLDSISEQTPHIVLNTETTDNEDIKLTAWIQWTITRFSVELLSYKMEDIFSESFSYNQHPNVKLVIEAEDIVSSLDFQSIYFKIKSKIGSASILHYTLDTKKWKRGQFLGLIMRTREDVSTLDKREDTSFANIIITRASCQHTHNLWGTSKKGKEKKTSSIFDLNNRFITEIVITVQPIDFLLPPIILQSFYMIFEPLLQISMSSKSVAKISTMSLHVNNTILPLAHLECKGFRIIIPSSELSNTGAAHDVCIFQVDNVNLVPEPTNPICRSPLRPDIYQQAARARILNIPGSDVEDRQYELTILGISCSTSTWEEFDPILNIQSSTTSRLKTMSENPALEWNLGKSHLSNNQNISLWPVINKFDLLITTAPAMILVNDVICGHSIEINFISNIEMNMSLSQIKLASSLHHEIITVFDLILNNYNVKRPRVYIPYSQCNIHGLEMEPNSLHDGLHDSGFETSDFKSSLSVKTKESSHVKLINETDKSSTIFSKSGSTMSNFVPLDILITAGKVSLVLYQFESGSVKGVKMSDYKKRKPLLRDFDKEEGYEGSEEGSIDERHDVNIKKFQPLMFLSVSQPNMFLSDLQLGRKIQLSCFDISGKVTASEYQSIRGIPTEKDFPVVILETRPGVPNPNTGVLPAFFTLKWCKGIGKPHLDIEIAKPMKILCSMERWIYLLTIKDKLIYALYFLSTFRKQLNWHSKFIKIQPRISKNQKTVDSYSKFKYIKHKLRGVSVLNIKLAQVVLSFRTENTTELNLCIGKVKYHLNVSNRPEKVTNMMTLESITLGVCTSNISRLVLNPWTISLDVSLFWESWQSIDSNPQIQISTESDCVMIDISPEELKCIELVKNEITEFLNHTLWEHLVLEEPAKESYKIPPSDKEQHYKDDLRAGAFHFVDSSSNNIEELPLPYQVMFWNRNIAAMAWRYPQPRALTKIRVFPVPFKISTGSQDDQQILCHLEYWSDCHGCYQPYTQFYLSESEMCHLDLPQSNNQPAVACIWRVVLSTHDSLDDDYNNSRVFVSPRALAGCIRVDSYFNKVLIPELTMALHLSSVSISLYNHIDKDLPLKMPECLNQYVSDLMFPKSQRFLTITLANTKAYLATWHFETIAFDVSTVARCDILDYGFLTQQPLIEPFASKLEICVNKCLNINFISKPINVKFGASAAHTLAVSAQMWEQSWQNKYNDNNIVNLIIMTHYIICNDTNVNLRFGQAGYEDILLPSRHCHLYSWRSQKFKQMIRVALEEFQWVWSEPFKIDKDGTEIIKITDDNVIIIITIKSLSTTQKQVVFSGQLIISNTLIEHFELKVVEAVERDKDKEFKNAATNIINGKSTPPSILINSNKKYFLRLRFFGLESAWSGDIPLMENTKCAQPWLVKVPLQERGQFLSIWCKVITQHFSKATKNLVIFWPLFMVRSNLPINSKVHIETPTLNVHIESTVRGKGEYQQLYCPGTIDHSHQLTFQLDDTPTSNPYVPLNYSLVDQKQFFKKMDKEDINEILSILSTYEKTNWPYFNEDFDGLEYVVEEQPLTHVQVRYQNACEHSSALLVELLPWCLILNTLGCSIAVIINEKELCRISHYGICTPPKLEETFYLGIGIGGTWNLSLPLQLAKSDWSQAFYMPKITGTIPMDGNIKTLVKCDPYICMVSITSSIVNEIRLLKISSTHVITNHMSLQMYAVCFAVPDNGICYNIPKKLDKHAFRIAPSLHRSNAGVSITQWYVIGKSIDTNTEYLFYLSFSINPKLGWSCPIQVDKNFMRRSISVKTEQKSVPVVLLLREYKSQLFLSLHHDIHPQLLIENKSGIKLFCAQYTGEDTTFVIDDCKHLKWLCSIDNESCTYYTMPIVSEKFPDIQQNNFSENLVFASDPEGDPQGFQWSNPIDVANLNDQFVRIPFYGDVKVSISRDHTTVVVIESVSQVEISARDIRVRLSMHENEYLSSLDLSKPVSAHPNRDLVDLKDDESNATPASTYFSAEDALQSSSNSSTAQSKLFLYPPQTLPTLLENSQVNMDVHDSFSSLDIELRTDAPKRKIEWNNLKILMFFKCVTFTLTSDLENGGAEKAEIFALTCDDIGLTINRTETMEVNLSISEIQFDNQLYFRGSYDFPVVLIGQNTTQIQPLNSLNVSVNKLIKNAQDNALILIKANFELWEDSVQQINITDVTDIRITIKPLATFIEDTYVTKLMDFLNVLTPTKLILWPLHKNKISFGLHTMLVPIPEHISWESAILAKPLVLRNFTIDSISILLSVHSSIKLYIALDQSPLQFGKFDKKNLLTTSYRLGHAITMHYLSGAIFGAGWVVGSLELLGSPGGLARAMGNGLRDFVSLPYRGLLQGPWAFLIGVTHGSASLMRHVTAGTLQSVTKLASSVARNLDRLTLDEEHLRRTEEQRRQRPQGLTQGFLQGLTGLGISLLGAVGGIAHHPLQSVMSDGASPRSLVTGVGLGIVGVFTKPLSGAADLLALTGQGLLQGAGWNPLPEARTKPVLCHIYSSPNSELKYHWKFMLPFTKTDILFVTEATAISNCGQYEAVALILTIDSLIIINTDEDMSQRILKLNELNGIDNVNDPTLLTLKLRLPKLSMLKPKNEDECIELDPASRARIADYVKNTVGLMHFTDNQSSEHSEISISPDASGEETAEETEKDQTTFTFYVNPQNRNYFLCLLYLAKQQHETYNFPVL